MTTLSAAAEAQRAVWNGAGGQAWVEAQDLLDRLFQPFEDLLLDPLSPGSEGPLLDVGCGTGATTLAAARRLGPAAEVLGIDLSAPMIARARQRAGDEAASARFLCADAASHPFAAGHFRQVVSRFGVMFFPDPVQAFRHLRHAAAPGAQLRFIAWRGAAENPFMTTAEHAAAPLLPQLKPREPDAPGQFGLADGARTRSILQAAGWSDIGIRAVDVDCPFPAAALETWFTRLGPLGQLLPELDAATRARVIAQVRPAFAPFVRDGRVCFTAACWCVDAIKPAQDAAAAETGHD